VSEMLEPQRGGEVRFDVKILHIFADEGVESEPLSAYGEVYRVGINPRGSEYNVSVIKADATEPLPFEEGEFDLVFLHPPCTFMSRLTNISGNRDDHENLIPRAREIGQRYGDHYVIENVPRAIEEEDSEFSGLREPEGGSLIRLSGKMFRIPIVQERAFECSFPVTQPEPMDIDTEISSYFFADRSTTYWRSLKQVSGDYRKEELAKAGMPSPYVHWIMRHWLRHVHPRDSTEARHTQ